MRIDTLSSATQLADFIYLFKEYLESTEIDMALSKEEYLEFILKSVYENNFIVNLAVVGGKTVGFITLRHYANKKELYIDDLYVKPEYRKQGIGKQLAWSLENIAEPTNAKRLYFKSISKPLKYWLRFTKGIQVHTKKQYYITREGYESIMRGE